MTFQTRLLSPALAALSLLLPAVSAAAEELPPFRQWGAETQEVLHKDMWLPEKKLYAERINLETGKPDHPSFMWGVGVQLSALAAAADVDPDKYASHMREYADAIQVYWWEHNGIEGFDVQPGPRNSDRYYDDNAWLVLALAEVHEITKEKKYLDRAEATFRFVMSGEDEKLDGGLYWRELEKTSKNTCTNAPAIVSALRLHQLTKDEKHLETAKRIYAWTNSKLQDADGLYWDNINMEGRIDRRKFSYNSALMIRANCLLNEVTGEASYLDEAKRIAKAAEKHWINEAGGVSDTGKFAHLLLESFLELHDRDKDPHWHALVTRCLVHLHDKLRDENGRYPGHWARNWRRPLRSVMLLDQASPARIYWLAAREIKAR
ncbi:glycoside hydrolase family 76 protein [Luteolibacter flavescens]|uniref:Glycoside hydrolase family 76 protein n=1 Tax=Luteolibacter flavescens TaxID=1859460 RepID=A0ABT3FK66_9BACT|nr:glycoside hydrolase family 76 protein [Luteolibacter flavescens]MCW1883609.1 glycoside hydrolase family 76 protein [Luteolibacter flavescens]